MSANDHVKGEIKFLRNPPPPSPWRLAYWWAKDFLTQPIVWFTCGFVIGAVLR